MATINTLKRQATDIEREITKLNAELSRKNQEYQNWHNREMGRLRNSMDTALREHDEVLQRTIQRKMDALDQQLRTQIAQNNEQLGREMKQELERRHRDLLRQVREYYQDVDSRITEGISAELDRRDSEKKQQALQELELVRSQYIQVSKRPHQQLFPNRMLPLEQTLGQAQAMLGQGQMEASIATSVILSLELKELGYDIDGKLRQWQVQYEVMEGEYRKIQGKVSEMLVIDGITIEEDTAMEWLGHRYDNVFRLLADCQAVVHEIHCYMEQASLPAPTMETVEQYFQYGGAVPVRQLEEWIRDLKYDIPGILKAMGQELHNGYRGMQQRKVWADKIISYMKAKHNTGNPICHGFDREGKEEPGSLYRMEFRAGEKDTVFVFHLVPVTINGTVANHIRIYMNFVMGSRRFQESMNQKYIQAMLELTEEEAVFIGIGTSEGVLDGAYDALYSLQRPRNGGPKQVIRHDPMGEATAPLDVSSHREGIGQQPSKPERQGRTERQKVSRNG